jgi:chromate reductase
LRQALLYVDVLTMAQPEAYVSQAGELVDEEFNITKEASRKFFDGFLKAFAAWIELTRKK